MRKIALIILSIFIFSCEDEPVEFTPVNDYSTALDTLKKFSDYILGDFNGKFLVSTNAHVKSYGASIVSMPLDSSHIQFQLAYKLLDDNLEKSVFVTYRLLESKNRLDADNGYKYNYFSDFIDFFDREKFKYYQLDQPIDDTHNVTLSYQNYYDINNDVNGFDTYHYDKQITPDNFNFVIDSIKAIESPVKKIAVYYSFKCIGVNYYGDELKMESGKGKSTFIY